MERERIQSAVDNFFASRLQNNANKTFPLFSNEATVRMVGAEDASAIAQSAKGKSAVESTARSLVDTWQWVQVERLSTLIDGNSAAARYILTTVHTPSGTTIKSENMDQFVFDDDLRISELIEFVDTALAERLEKL